MSNLVTFNYNELPVLFQTDGYLNATQIAKGFNKSPKDYLKLNKTKDYISSVGKKLLTQENQLVIVKQGGLADEQGTWLHPKLALDFARWLDSDFAVWCDEQIDVLLHKGTVSIQPMSHLEILAQSAMALVEMDKRQTKLEEDVKLLAAKIEKSPQEHFTVAGFASLRGVNVNVREAAALGRKASKLSKEWEMNVGKAHSEIFGEVNTYHVDVLSKVFSEIN
jgi:hypothetical protein